MIAEDLRSLVETVNAPIFGVDAKGPGSHRGSTSGGFGWGWGQSVMTHDMLKLDGRRHVLALDWGDLGMCFLDVFGVM